MGAAPPSSRLARSDHRADATHTERDLGYMTNIITVDFRQDTLFAVERDDGVFVALKPMCDAMGIEWRPQRERLTRDPILAEGRITMVLPSPGGPQETVCLRLDLVNGWLFTIDESRVKDEDTRQKVLAYKRECHAVLFKHFHGKPEWARSADAPPVTEEAEVPRVRLVTEARQTFGTASAAQLWFKLGLPIVPAMLHDPRQADLLEYNKIKPADAAA